MSASFRILTLLVLAGSPAVARPQAVRLVESLPPGTLVHVESRVTIDGHLVLPADKGQAARKLSVGGTSKIEYDERQLSADRTIRDYGKMEFRRTLGDEEQQSGLRAEVSRLVILRHKHHEVPFCPTGPLTLGEIELIRTDVFTLALRGLLPARAVQLGERWSAGIDAVQELTDLERVESGGLACKLEGIVELLRRRMAQVSFEGTVRGLDKDGKAEHQIAGSLYFNLDQNYIASITVTGTHLLPGPDGQAGGEITGQFTLTRSLRTTSSVLSDTALRSLTLEPNDDNTRLLFDNAALGLRLLYPRNWAVVGTNPSQVGLDDGRGSGLWLVVDPGPPNPAAVQQFYQAVQKGLVAKKAQVRRVSKLESLQPGIATFSIDANLGNREVTLLYYVVQQPAGAATVTATLVRNAPELRRDVQRIVRSVQLSSPALPPAAGR